MKIWIRRNKFKFLALTLVALLVSVYPITAGGLWALSRMAESTHSPPDTTEVTSKEINKMRLIDNGMASLYQRLHLIHGAKKTIELEFFIYDIDQASRLLTQALVERAHQGVKIRLLVDFSAPVFQLKPAYAHFMKSHGIEVRYYNTSAIYRIVSSQHRSHRKLLIVDDESLVTGGRNIANDYFDLGETYNFLDSDIEVRGPITKSVVNSFNLYWNSDLTTNSDSYALTKKPVIQQQVASFLETNEKDSATLSKINDVGAKNYAAGIDRECNDLTFVTDLPGHNESSRKVFNTIVKTLSEAKNEIWAESPYFIMKNGGLEILQDLHNRKVSLSVLTNSLYSTDASYAVAALYLNENQLAATGLSLYAFRGEAVEGHSSHSEGRWGTHAKRAVIDSKTVMIGTYNIDPRSANLNSELLFVCRNNPELAADMRASIAKRFKHSNRIIAKGQIQADESILANSSLTDLIKFAILLPLSNLFDFLL